MKSKKNKVLLIGTILLLVVLVFPIRMVYLDGGTVTYNAILYKIIYWNGFPDNHFSGRKNEKDIILFPENFHSLEYYMKLEPREIYAHTELIEGIFDKNYSNSGIKYVKCNIGSYSLVRNIDGKKYTAKKNALHPVLQDYLNILEINNNDTIYLDNFIENIQIFKIDNLIPIETKWHFDDNINGITLYNLEPNMYIISFQYKLDSNNLTNYSFKIKVV